MVSVSGGLRSWERPSVYLQLLLHETIKRDSLRTAVPPSQASAAGSSIALDDKAAFFSLSSSWYSLCTMDAPNTFPTAVVWTGRTRARMKSFHKRTHFLSPLGMWSDDAQIHATSRNLPEENMTHTSNLYMPIISARTGL